MTGLKKDNTIKRYLLLILSAAVTALLIVYASEIKDSVLSGARIAFLTVVPTLFPFMIVSDIFAALPQKSSGAIPRSFGRLFCGASSALNIFILGSVCGFPLGVKCASEKYKTKEISKEECEELIGFVNNPSLAFVISGVGLGMMGSIRIGVFLYSAVIISSLAVAAMFCRKVQKAKNINDFLEQKFDLALSIKNSALQCINISAYIIFFSTLLGLIKSVSRNAKFTELISPLLEIGNAVSLLVNSGHFSDKMSFILLGFALGFSGFSVHLQAFSLLPKEISKRKYIIMKITQGIICALICAVFYRFII
ncbi:MAG: hypothetical protein IJX92_00270 [Clostridia bacterium]|nr:hypothetical protein [Clostridia bacterium]